MDVKDVEIQQSSLSKEDNYFYIEKKNKNISEELGRVKRLFLQIPLENYDVYLLNDRLLKSVMSVVEDVDRIIKASKDIDMNLHAAYIILALNSHKKDLKDLLDGITNAYYNINSNKDSVDYKEVTISNYWKAKILDVNDKKISQIREKFDFACVEKQLSTFHQERLSTIDGIVPLIEAFINYGMDCIDDCLENKDCSIFKVRTINKCAITYWRNNKKIEEDNLTLLIKKSLKEWRKNLYENDWEKQRQREDKVLNSVLSGEKWEEVDEIKSIYESIYNEMKSQIQFIKAYKEMIPDEKLYDIVSAVDKNFTMNAALRYDNINLFYKLTLRFNIIQYHIFPELETQFKELIGESGVLEESVVKAKFVSSVDRKTQQIKIEDDILNYVAILEDHFVAGKKKHRALWKKIIKAGNKKEKNTNYDRRVSYLDKNYNKGVTFNKSIVHSIIGELIRANKYRIDSGGAGKLLNPPDNKRTVSNAINRTLKDVAENQDFIQELTSLLQ